MGFDNIQNLSYESFKQVCHVRTEVIPPQHASEEPQVRLTTHVIFTSEERLPYNSTSDVTEEDIERAKNNLYKYLKKPVLTKEQFEELMRQIHTWRY